MQTRCLSMLAFIFFSIQLIISNGNNFLKTDCLSLTTEINCNEYSSICSWDIEKNLCKFLYQNNDILGAKKIDLVFILDAIIPEDIPLFISSTVTTLYNRYDSSMNRDGVSLRCGIIPYQTELKSCADFIDIESINNLLLSSPSSPKPQQDALMSNFQSGIDLLFKTNSINDRLRDQYIIPSIDTRHEISKSYKLCKKINELALFRIYPFLIQWKADASDANFESICEQFQHQPQFIHKINKYDPHRSFTKIAANVASKIHRNSINPARYSSLNTDCVPYNLASQSYAIRDDILWLVSGDVEIPTVSPTTDPTTDPTFSPTDAPTFSPTDAPTDNPTNAPTDAPTRSPTHWPTPAPTAWPTKWPTPAPTAWPTRSPTPAPTRWPSPAPTAWPSRAPIPAPTRWPSPSPTVWPSRSPIKAPTKWPSPSPTAKPTKVIWPTAWSKSLHNNDVKQDDTKINSNSNRKLLSTSLSQSSTFAWCYNPASETGTGIVYGYVLLYVFLPSYCCLTNVLLNSGKYWDIDKLSTTIVIWIFD